MTKYVYAGEELLLIVYDFYSHTGEDYRILQGALSAKYGAPMNIGPDETLGFMNLITGERRQYERERIKEFRIWKIDENTRVSLYYFTQSAFMIVYENLPKLRALTGTVFNEDGL